MTEILSLTGFLLALAAVFIGAEALRRVSPRLEANDNAPGTQSFQTMQKRIETLEQTIDELQNREKMAKHRFNPEYSEAERFAPSHHILKNHYLA